MDHNKLESQRKKEQIANLNADSLSEIVKL